MRIQFVLDLIPINPMGGVKMIFSYANHFANRGDEVIILLAPHTYFQRLYGIFPYWIRKELVKLYLNERGIQWFNLHKNVRFKLLDAINNNEVQDGDAIFATAVGTAKPVSKLDKSKGKKFYLIQDYENWHLSDEEVDETYRLGLHNIVVSKWLQDKVDTVSSFKSTLILNPINTNVFKIKIKPEDRHPHSIAMIRQTDERKGFSYGLEAVKKVKDLFPDTELTIFSIYKRTEEIPNWVRYVEKANESQLVSIYNSSAVFLCSSIQEGYGLCGAESMACGCTLVSTDYQGVHSYAMRDKDVLLSPVRDVMGLVDNISALFSNNARRIEMAYQGHKNIQKTSWDEAYQILDKIVNEKDGEYF